MDHIEVKEELLEEDIIEIKEEPLEDTEVKQEAAETEELEGSGRRGEKRTLSRSCSPEAAPDAKKQRPEVEEMRIEDEPAFDKTEVALDWCKCFPFSIYVQLPQGLAMAWLNLNILYSI